MHAQSYGNQHSTDVVQLHIEIYYVNKITVCHGVRACGYNTATRCVVISELEMP